MTLAEQYADALHSTASGGKPAAELFANFVAMLKRRGHYKLLPQIARAYERTLRRGRHDVLSVRVARTEDMAAALAHAKELFAQGEPTTTVDMALVSGFSITGRDFRFDASGRRALLELYRKLTA